MGRPPLSRTLDVHLNGRLAGHYRCSPAGGTSFDYAAGWLDWEHAFPVSRQLPLGRGRQSGENVSAVFENLLPDNGQLRRLIAERTSARSERPHDLLAAIGRDCVGALQFLPEGADPGDPFRLAGEVQDEAQIAATLRGLSQAPLGMEGDAPFRISLAGAQEKTAFLRQDGKWLKPEGLTPTTHIFKRPMGLVGGGLDLSDSVENEFVCLRLARAMGLPACRAEIARFEDETVLVVERFDRAPRRAGGILRLPQEDVLQAMGLASAMKYQQHGGPGMVSCLRLLAASERPAEDMAAFLKAQLFNWLIAGVDGHAKNYAIFLRPGGFRMTPLYDIVSAAPAHLRNSFRHRELQLAMAAGRRGHYRLDRLHPRHFEETAARARVPLESRRSAFLDLALAGPAAFAEVAADLPAGIPERIAAGILDYARDRHRTLADYAGTAFPD
ncbi:HipA domain-containing protein [Mangrovicoccus sp. HB161399]|uniref:HipA domain-containing protein n=1 Tax=Mangrovicoccus sp. HB161399 TaxID=2720392 RepID=UPI001551F484|nr:HipA domain-containing protein [Mangrovicoccus sp. HB161399]